MKTTKEQKRLFLSQIGKIGGLEKSKYFKEKQQKQQLGDFKKQFDHPQNLSQNLTSQHHDQYLTYLFEDSKSESLNTCSDEEHIPNYFEENKLSQNVFDNKDGADQLKTTMVRLIQQNNSSKQNRKYILMVTIQQAFRWMVLGAKEVMGQKGNVKECEPCFIELETKKCIGFQTIQTYCYGCRNNKIKSHKCQINFKGNSTDTEKEINLRLEQNLKGNQRRHFELKQDVKENIIKILDCMSNIIDDLEAIYYQTTNNCVNFQNMRAHIDCFKSKNYIKKSKFQLKTCITQLKYNENYSWIYSHISNQKIEQYLILKIRGIELGRQRIIF
ncbi:hypothetical protein ABPG72_020535 [Tetrahymena utriculariae]